MEGRVASDQELKLTELLRYYMRDIQAAKVRHVLSFNVMEDDMFVLLTQQAATLSTKARAQCNVSQWLWATLFLIQVIPITYHFFCHALTIAYVLIFSGDKYLFTSFLFVTTFVIF